MDFTYLPGKQGPVKAPSHGVARMVVRVVLAWCGVGAAAAAHRAVEPLVVLLRGARVRSKGYSKGGMRYAVSIV